MRASYSPRRDQKTIRPPISLAASTLDDTDWHALQKDRFAHDLADLLYARAHKGQFEKIVIVAAPHVLGELRKALHKEVADRVIAEIPKTLTGQPLHEIEANVAKELAA